MNNYNVSQMKDRKSAVSSVQMLVLCAMFIALTYVFTNLQVRLPIAANGGLVHLGNIPLFIGAILFGPYVGAIAGGIGMGLFDLLGGWVAWAPFTFIVVGLMGFSVGFITKKRKSYVWNVVAFVVALVIKIVGYYIAEGIIFGNWVAPLSSIPGNIIQIGVAAPIVFVVVLPLKRIVNRIM